MYVRYSKIWQHLLCPVIILSGVHHAIPQKNTFQSTCCCQGIFAFKDGLQGQVCTADELNAEGRVILHVCFESLHGLQAWMQPVSSSTGVAVQVTSEEQQEVMAALSSSMADKITGCASCTICCI